MRPGVQLLHALVTVMVLSSLMGCSALGLDEALPDQRLVYKKQHEVGENLEIPPDLAGSNFNDTLDIPPGNGATTFSEYSGHLANRNQDAHSTNVLPTVANVELKRTGNERLLEAQVSPQQIWPKLIAFWREQGILLVEQDPKVGMMRTDWLDNRAEIRKDFVTRMLGKVLEGAYSTSTRDQYTVLIENGMRPGTTDIRLTHRGMVEKLVTNTISQGGQTIWEPSGTDPVKEAEMLRRLMIFLGASQQSATANAAASPAAPNQGSRSQLLVENGTQVLLIPEEFRRAWRLIGSTLDWAGFAVEDRDQSRGIYYVRYAGKDASGKTNAEKPGLMSRLAFWRKSDIDQVKQYQVQVIGNDTESRITVLDANGKPEQSESGRRILSLLHEQMR